MNNPLSFEDARVLGCLLEKQMAMPDYYPLARQGNLGLFTLLGIKECPPICL